MSADLPPTIDPRAAARWGALHHEASPWLHEEVARRMEDRLQWIKLVPGAWVHWEPARGGLQAHAALARRYPQAQCHVVEAAANLPLTRSSLRRPWWDSLPWGRPATHFGAPADGSVQMVWANMALHMVADPQALIGVWQRWLATDGFLMFSCLGPDTLRELRDAYQAIGWRPPAHAFTDMHDWGDMLVRAGFAEPVMDMERITLTFDNAPRCLQELRQLGRNLHVGRDPVLHGRAWHRSLLQVLDTLAIASPQRHALTFELIYGHAIKAAPRLPVGPETRFPLSEMRSRLRGGRRTPDGHR